MESEQKVSIWATFRDIRDRPRPQKSAPGGTKLKAKAINNAGGLFVGRSRNLLLSALSLNQQRRSQSARKLRLPSLRLKLWRLSMQQRRGRRVERMAGVSKRGVDHIETRCASAIQIVLHPAGFETTQVHKVAIVRKI
jgi:hypothetical protein